MPARYELASSHIPWPDPIVDPLPDYLIEILGPERLSKIYMAKLQATQTQLRAQQKYVSAALEVCASIQR